MDELKYLTNKNNIQQVTVGLQKLLKAIRAVKAQGTKENQIKEIDFLRELCSSEYSNLSLLAHQAFVRLVEDGTIEAAACLSMFMTMLPNTKYNQYTAVTEGIVDLLLLDLKRRGALVEPSKNYTCPFGLKAPQHPIITLMQKNESSLSDLTNKINGICNHHDNGIRQHSIEFLRPVFLYTLCNPTSIPDSITIWTCLLSHVKKSSKAKELVDEILCYRKTSSATATLTTSLLISDAITIMIAHGNVKTAVQFSFYLTAVLNDLVTCGYDPRPGFRIIRQAISEMKQSDRLTCDLMLILLNHSLHNVSPVYLPDVVRLLKLIIITMNGGNQVTRAMILDGLIVWIANFSLVPTDGLHEMKELIDFIIKSDGQVHLPIESVDSNHPCNVQFHHPSVAIGYQLAILSHRLDKVIHGGDGRYLKEFLDSVQEPSQQRFGNQIQLFLRGIFLNDKLQTRLRLQILKILLKLVKEDQDVATGLLLPVLFKLSREKEPIVQLELLRGLTQFAVVKENIPTILNTLNSMTSGVLRSLSLDLYLRLWKQENRTYPFLHKLLHSSKEKDKESNELTIAKAFTIKEICELKPTQHGTDLVVHLSNILNQSSGSEGETSTTLAIEAIIILCNSHTVNIASTWKALSQKFDNENRKRPTIMLCKFFGQVPLLRSITQEYETLYTEAVSKLWNYIVQSDCSEVINSALAALQNFDYCGLALAQIPDVFRQNLAIPSGYIKNVGDAKTIDAVDVLDYIPGQCWVQLIQKVNPSAIGSAADLVSHYIYNEIEAYRGGVYHLPEGKPEPNNLKQLHNRSPLRYVVEYLMVESKKPIGLNRPVVLNCLRCLSKKFPKPIPPLDIYFVIHFMNDDIEMKTYCIRLLANQVIQSGTAKNLLENYVAKFGDDQLNDFQEVEIILDVLVDLVNGISVDISEKLLKQMFEFSLRRCATEPIIFEKLLAATKRIFTETCRNEDAMQMVVGIVESYFDLIAQNTKIFEKFMELCEHIPSPRLDEMISPNSWREIHPEKFRKATLVRCHLAINSQRLDNSLFWLNPIVDSVHKFKNDQPFVLENIAAVLHRYGNDKSASNWTMEIQSRVQAALLEKSEHSEFLMDLFMLCLVVSSGCSTLYGNIENIASCRQDRLEGFPAALHILSERAFWRDCSVRIYEFLFHVYTHTNLPICFIEAAKNALICTKNDFYFTQKNNWMKYIGLRRASKSFHSIHSKALTKWNLNGQKSSAVSRRIEFVSSNGFTALRRRKLQKKSAPVRVSHRKIDKKPALGSRKMRRTKKITTPARVSPRKIDKKPDYDPPTPTEMLLAKKFKDLTVVSGCLTKSVEVKINSVDSDELRSIEMDLSDPNDMEDVTTQLFEMPVASTPIQNRPVIGYNVTQHHTPEYERAHSTEIILDGTGVRNSYVHEARSNEIITDGNGEEQDSTVTTSSNEFLENTKGGTRAKFAKVSEVKIEYNRKINNVESEISELEQKIKEKQHEIRKLKLYKLEKIHKILYDK